MMKKKVSSFLPPQLHQRHGPGGLGRGQGDGHATYWQRHQAQVRHLHWILQSYFHPITFSVHEIGHF